jgi:hypothetical protein
VIVDLGDRGQVVGGDGPDGGRGHGRGLIGEAFFSGNQIKM